MEITSGKHVMKAITARLNRSETPNALIVFGDRGTSLVHNIEPLVDELAVLDDEPQIVVQKDSNAIQEWGMFAFANKIGSLLRVQEQWIINVVVARNDNSMNCAKFNMRDGTPAQVAAYEFGPGYSQWGILNTSQPSTEPVLKVHGDTPIFDE